MLFGHRVVKGISQLSVHPPLFNDFIPRCYHLLLIVSFPVRVARALYLCQICVVYPNVYHFEHFHFRAYNLQSPVSDLVSI